MTTSNQAPLLLHLWNDKGARSVIIQIVTVALLFAFFAYLVRNAAINLEAIGKGYSFRFLSDPASYDINQHLIEYNSRSTHLRAAVVGVLNTLLLAFFGIISATVLGFILGVLRLSQNWLVSRVVYCLVEYLRNVPLLLHIIMVHTILVNSLPGVKQAVSIADAFFFSVKGFYMPGPIAEPAMWLVFIALIVAIAFACWFTLYAKKVQNATGKIYPVSLVNTGAIICLPVVVYLLAGSPLSWEIPVLVRFNFAGGLALKPELLAMWLALTLYTSAFIAEIVRSGIQAVSRGQTEASYALGIKPSRTMRLIIIPQALRVIVPPLCSQYLNLAKNSSLAIAIGYMDTVATIGGISLNQTGREMECMTIVLLIYLGISLTISTCMNWFNNRIKLVER